MSEKSEHLKRATVPELDSILGEQISVLGDGFIRVIDYMGNDSAIVQMARTSYGSGTKTIRDDRGLIRYLMRKWHSSPFEGCELKLHFRVPMDIWRHIVRHRAAVESNGMFDDPSVNEYSTRYSVAIDSANQTPQHKWRLQSSGNRQGSSGYLDAEEGAVLSKTEQRLHAFSREVYESRLRLGVAREQARKDLPLSTMTEAYWKMDLKNVLDFLWLRLDEHTQEETRFYAEAISKIVSVWVPLTWEAFLDYRVGALNLTRLDVEILRAIEAVRHGEDLEVLHKTYQTFGWLDLNENGRVKRDRERDEFEMKAIKLHLPAEFYPTAFYPGDE